MLCVRRGSNPWSLVKGYLVVHNKGTSGYGGATFGVFRCESEAMRSAHPCASSHCVRLAQLQARIV